MTQAASPASGEAVLPATRCVAILGNPNTGKTTLFNALTGLTQHVGNYPGVTVEKKVGLLKTADGNTTLIDLPGCYSIAARSPDEMVAIDVLLGRMPDCPRPDMVVVVADASNLERNFYLTTQVLELGVPVVVCLNMIDSAEAAGIRIDTEALADELGVKIIPTAAQKRRGLKELREAILHPADLPLPAPVIDYPPTLHRELEQLQAYTKDCNPAVLGDCPTPFENLRMLLEIGGQSERRWAERFGEPFQIALDSARNRLQEAGVDLSILETHTRYNKIGELLVRYVRVEEKKENRLAKQADRLLTNRFFGTLIFLSLMALVFQSIYAWSAPLMDGIDSLFGATANVVSSLLPSGALRSFLTDGVIGGVGAVVIFLPQILVLFLFIAVLEDCGYLPRAAFLMDRLLSKGGLSGKAFIPLLSSFACAIPGIMAARVIENRRDRMVTILVAPLMSCSARLPVYTILIGTFVPSTALLGGWFNMQGLSLFLMYLVGAAIAIPVALILRRTLFQDDANQLVLLELPPYKWPSARNVFMRMYIQGRAFLMRAGTVIFAVTVVVWALTYYPRPSSILETYETQRTSLLAAHGITDRVDGAEIESPIVRQELQTLGAEEAGVLMRQSFLGRTGRLIEPLVAPLGWDWKIGTAVVASFPAREVVIAVLGVVYDLGGDEDEESESLMEKLRGASRPDGTPVYTLPVVFSIMVFFALCAQCGATLATIRRETNSWRWPVFVFGYMTVLAYLGAFLTFQVGTLLLGG